jgi:hypothetical protein
MYPDFCQTLSSSSPTLTQGSQHVPNKINFILIHPMAHTGIKTHGHIAAQALKHLGAQFNPSFGDMEIRIAATQKDRGIG